MFIKKKRSKKGNLKIVERDVQAVQNGIKVSIEKKKTSKRTYTIVKGCLYQNCLFESVEGSKVEYECKHCNAELRKKLDDYYLYLK